MCGPDEQISAPVTLPKSETILRQRLRKVSPGKRLVASTDSPLLGSPAETSGEQTTEQKRNPDWERSV